MTHKMLLVSEWNPQTESMAEIGLVDRIEDVKPMLIELFPHREIGEPEQSPTELGIKHWRIRVVTPGAPIDAPYGMEIVEIDCEEDPTR